MGTKWLRQYELRIDFFKENEVGNPSAGYSVAADSQIYTLPFTIVFQTEHNTLEQPNNISIQLFNLNIHDRNLIRKNNMDWSKSMVLTLRAGYQTTIDNNKKLPVIFNGMVQEAWSERQGTDFITYIRAYDGGFAYGEALTHTTFGAGTTRQNILKTLHDSLNIYGVQTGKISSAYQGAISKDTAYHGPTTKILSQETNHGFFTYNNVSFSLTNNDFSTDEILYINSESGLLGTPKYMRNLLGVDLLFEPRAQMKMQVNLSSLTAPNYNTQDYEGNYSIVGIKHDATISMVECGDATTSLTLLTTNTGQLD